MRVMGGEQAWECVVQRRQNETEEANATRAAIWEHSKWKMQIEDSLDKKWAMRILALWGNAQNWVLFTEANNQHNCGG